MNKQSRLTDSASTTIDTTRIGFFIGAGASSEFGIPSMKKMTTTFAEKIQTTRGEYEQKKLFAFIYKSLTKAYIHT